MIKLKRLTTFLLALMMVVTILASCDTLGVGNDETTTDTAGVTSAPEETTQPVQNDIKIILNKASNGRVVRPDNAQHGAMSITCASDIHGAIGKATGVEPEIATDWVQGGIKDPDTFEILVGITDYEESTQVLSGIGYGEYVVKVIGNKLVVAAYSDTALKAATNELIRHIQSVAEEGTLTITADTYIANAVDAKLAALPFYEGGTFSSTYPCSDNGIMVLVNKTNADEYQEYLDKLETEGYTEYTTNEITDNHFATYNNDAYTVNAGFYDYEKTSRIIIEPLAKPVGLEEDNKYTAVTTSQITSFGLEYRNSSGDMVGNGLSILIRLVDGRFIIVDGGWNRGDCSNNLVNAMLTQSKDYRKAGEKITIAAWIVTHAHGDHSGVLSRASSFSNFKVEKILVNFIDNAERLKAIAKYPSDYSANEGGGYTNVLNAAKIFGADVLWVHVGQVFYIADLKIEVLYTIESYGPKICNAFNTTSLVMKMTFNEGEDETTFMLNGDATGNALEICAKMFGQYLKSDIVQVAHHGYSTRGNDGGVMLAYSFMQPETVFWPMGHTAYSGNHTKAHNVVLFSPEYKAGGRNPNFKEVYVSGAQGETIIYPIPYKLGDAIVKRN